MKYPWRAKFLYSPSSFIVESGLMFLYPGPFCSIFPLYRDAVLVLISIIMKSVVKKDDAVSPVIGTILLVAITVVLVAIVAAVVMGMTGGLQSTKDVGVTVTPAVPGTADSLATVTFYGGSDVKNLVGPVKMYNVTSGAVADNASTSFAVGQPYMLKGTLADFVGQTPVNIVANFTDGSSSVLYTGTINFPTTRT